MSQKITDTQIRELLTSLAIAAPKMAWYRWTAGDTGSGFRSICRAYHEGFCVILRRHDHRNNRCVNDKWLPRKKMPVAEQVWVELEIRDDTGRFGRSVVLPRTAFVIGEPLYGEADSLERAAVAVAGPGWSALSTRLPVAAALEKFRETL